MTNSRKLKAAIVEQGMTQEKLADALGIARATFNNKLNGKTFFTEDELMKMKSALNLTNEQFLLIFFDENVELKSH